MKKHLRTLLFLFLAFNLMSCGFLFAREAGVISEQDSDDVVHALKPGNMPFSLKNEYNKPVTLTIKWMMGKSKDRFSVSRQVNPKEEVTVNLDNVRFYFTELMVQIDNPADGAMLGKVNFNCKFPEFWPVKIIGAGLQMGWFDQRVNRVTYWNNSVVEKCKAALHYKTHKDVSPIPPIHKEKSYQYFTFCPYIDHKGIFKKDNVASCKKVRLQYDLTYQNGEERVNDPIPPEHLENPLE